MNDLILFKNISIVTVVVLCESEPLGSVRSMDEVLSNSSVHRDESSVDCLNASTPRPSVRFADSSLPPPPWTTDWTVTR